MTSPRNTSTEPPPAMATPALSPPNLEFTATDNAVNDNKNIPTLDGTATTSTVQSSGTSHEIRDSLKQDSSTPNEQEIGTTQSAILTFSQADPTHPSQAPLSNMSDTPQIKEFSTLASSTFAQPAADKMSAIDTSPLPANGFAMDESLLSQGEPLLPPMDPSAVDQTHRISAYAMLEFEDGQFYMTTYSVILGRDLTAARAAMRREAEEQQTKHEDNFQPKEPKTPVRIKGEDSRYTKSVVSESGGILREGNSESDDLSRRRKNRKASKKSKSTGSSSQPVSRRNSLVQANGRIDYQPQSQVKLFDPDLAGPVPVDPASLRPSPYECPLVGIHPPAATPVSGYKAISRKHVKISYNIRKMSFEAEIVGRNGAFVDDMFYYHHDIVPLKSGSLLQIGGVVVRFVLPDVTLGQMAGDDDQEGRTTGETYAEGGKQMSFDFENTPRDGALLEDTSESEDADYVRDDQDDDVEDIHEKSASVDSEAELDDGEGFEGAEDKYGIVNEEDVDEEENSMEEPYPTPQLPKRRGPGRPPKNGVMSKREQQLAKKEAQQKAKKSLPEEIPIFKNKVGRPRKHPRPESPPIKREKRKYTKRKSKDPALANLKQEGSGDESQSFKDKRDKKSTKPPRSPTPTFNEEDLTEEQLAKPSTNYVNLIYEAISQSPTGQMSLPQIYRAIQRKYPFFVLKCTTNGWQSSVRHNLSQHHAFKKVERDGKGWLWAIVDGVSIEKEKKRRPSPTHQLPPGHLHHQPIYRGPPPQHMIPASPNMMGAPSGFPLSEHLGSSLIPGQPPQYFGQQSNNYPILNVNGQIPNGFGPSLAPSQAGGPQHGTYSSPYAPKPNGPVPGPPLPPSTTTDQKVPAQTSLAAVSAPIAQSQHSIPPPNEQILHAVEIFKTALISSLRGKSNNADAIVASAINRVLGYTTQSTVPGDPHEERIMVALRGMLSKIPGANYSSPVVNQSTQNGMQPQVQSGPKSSRHTEIATKQSNASVSSPAPTTGTKPSTLIHTIQRPSFTNSGQLRHNGAAVSVPRPPMMASGSKRTGSGSPATTPARPETDFSFPVANDSKTNLNDNGKRNLEEVDDTAMSELKRPDTTVSTSLKV